MGEKDLSKKILEEIKQSHIKPVPKWEFLLKSWVIWSLFGVALVLGSLAVSVILFIGLNSHLPENLTLTQKIILSLPYFWIIVLAVFTIIAYYNFRITEKGYQKRAYSILLTSIVASIILGSGIYSFGGGERLESFFYSHIPFYQKLMHEKGKILVAPEYGHIAGQAEKVELKTFVIRDFHGRVWVVTVPTSTPDVDTGRRLIIYGKQTADNKFEAEAVEELYHRNPIFKSRGNKKQPDKFEVPDKPNKIKPEKETGPERNSQPQRNN